MGWVKYATVGAKAGDNIKDEAGNVLDNDEIRNVDLTISQGSNGVFTLNRGGGGTDTTTINKSNLGLNYAENATVGATWDVNVGGSNKPANNATVGAIFGSNMYSAGTTLFTAAQLKNANQAWGDVSGSGIPANNATVGAIAGTNLYKENGSTSLGDDDIVTNAGTSANTAAVGSVSASNAQDRLGAITNAGVWDGTTIAINKGGTGETASTTWLNSNVTTFNVDKSQSIEWTNISGQLSPSATTNDWIITWKNGAATDNTLGQTKIRAATSSATSLAAAADRTSTDGLTAPSGVSVSVGGAVNSGVIQTTTITLNNISCILTARILDGSGWGFKQEGAPKNLTERKVKLWHLK